MQPKLIALSVFALGCSCVITQLALLREWLAAVAGNEMVLGIILGLWLLLMGLGTWLGRAAGRRRNPFPALFLAQICVAVIPLAQVLALRAGRGAVFTRGAEPGVTETVLAVLLLLLPYCVAAGYALTLACALWIRAASGAPEAAVDVAPERPERRIYPAETSSSGVSADPLPPEGGAPESAAGRVYVADSVGSIFGGLLFSFVLVRYYDHLGILIYPALLNLLVVVIIGIHCGRRGWAAAAAILAVGLAATTLRADLDALSTGWQYRPQRIVARGNSPYGKLLVTQSDGQFDFLENGVPFTSTRDDQHVEETVHYAMAQRPGAGKVLLIGGGISGTAKEILKYGVEEVDYVELDPLILEFGRKFLPDKLNAPQIQTINADGRLYLKQADDEYDVIIIDVPDPSTAQLNRFYTAECFAAGKQALSEDGVLAFSLGHYENYLSPELARLLASARRSVATAFAHVLMIPGGRVFFLASDAPIFTNIARRIEQERISTKLVNQHYLDAILTPDRRLDMERAAAQPAALNRDFSPMLYYYHLRHWLSQFRGGVGVLPVLLAALVCVCIVRLRGPALVLFASGFAGTSLEIVLLLAFQILCGSVYHQIGIIVTVFMAGLALGAASANRSLSRGAGFPPASPAGILAAPESGGQHARETRSRDGCVTAAKSLALLAFAIAAAAIVLPLLLPLLNHVGGTTLSLIFIKTAVALLTFGLAALVGLQFPLANRLESGDPVAGAARLYTADFLGAFLGALLVSAWLLPLLGVTGVCLLIAALNFIAGLGIQFRKVAS